MHPAECLSKRVARRGSCVGHVASSNPLDELARQRAHLSVLLSRGSDDLQGNLSRHIARPTLVRVERDDAQNTLVFTPQDALDDGVLISPDLVDLTPHTAVPTEVLRERVDGQVASGY